MNKEEEYKQKLNIAGKRIDAFGNIIPKTNEELMTMVARMEQDQFLLLEWKNLSTFNPKMRGDKI